MRHPGTFMPRFCVEFRYLLYGQSGLAWGAIFEKVSKYQEKCSFSKYACPFFQEQVPKMSFSPCDHRQLPWLVLQYFQTHELYQNGWSFSISRYTSYIRMAGFSIFPGPQSIRLTDDPYFTFISNYFQMFFKCWVQIPIPASSIQWILQCMPDPHP